MNVASLELCKELYELSGWDYKSQYVHATDNYSDGRAKHLLTREMLGENPFDTNLKYKFIAPAYDLGYLLRKLPICTIIKKDSRYKYLSFAREKYVDVGMQTAKTPEDAAAKLAIELIKQGVLK